MIKTRLMKPALGCLWCGFDPFLKNLPHFAVCVSDPHISHQIIASFRNSVYNYKENIKRAIYNVFYNVVLI